MTGHNHSRDVRRSYARIAESYDHRWASYVDATTRLTLAPLDLRAGEALLDVGCGTGVLLRHLANRSRGAQFLGVDLSPEMLARALARLENAAGLAVADAAALPFSGGSFDAVVSGNVVHFWSDPAACLLEIRRVLRPGGQLVITDWCDDYLVCRICDLWLRVFDPAHVRTYGSVRFGDMIRAAGFRDVKVTRGKISWFWGMMTATARC